MDHPFKNTVSDGEIWRIQDDIKYGKLNFRIGDDVMVFCKRPDGYPRHLQIGDFGRIVGIELNHFTIDFSQTYKNLLPNGISPTSVKIAKKYMASKMHIRDLKINRILS